MVPWLSPCPSLVSISSLSTNVSSLSICFPEISEPSHFCKTLSFLLSNPAKNSLCTSLRLNSLNTANQNQTGDWSFTRAFILLCTSLEMTLLKQFGIVPLFLDRILLVDHSSPASGSQLSCWWITAVPLVDQRSPIQPWVGERLRRRLRETRGVPLCLMERIRQLQ